MVKKREGVPEMGTKPLKALRGYRASNRGSRGSNRGSKGSRKSTTDPLGVRPIDIFQPCSIPGLRGPERKGEEKRFLVTPWPQHVSGHVRDTCMKFLGINKCKVNFTCWLHVENVSELIMYLFRPQWY